MVSVGPKMACEPRMNLELYECIAACHSRVSCSSVCHLCWQSFLLLIYQ